MFELFAGERRRRDRPNSSATESRRREALPPIHGEALRRRKKNLSPPLVQNCRLLAGHTHRERPRARRRHLRGLAPLSRCVVARPISLSPLLKASGTRGARSLRTRRFHNWLRERTSESKGCEHDETRVGTRGSLRKLLAGRTLPSQRACRGLSRKPVPAFAAAATAAAVRPSIHAYGGQCGGPQLQAGLRPGAPAGLSSTPGEVRRRAAAPATSCSSRGPPPSESGRAERPCTPGRPRWSSRAPQFGDTARPNCFIGRRPQSRMRACL